MHPPLPLHSFCPRHACDSGTAQPPLPLHSFLPMQQSRWRSSAAWEPAAVALAALTGACSGDADAGSTEAAARVAGFGAVSQPVCAPSTSADTALGSHEGRLCFMPGFMPERSLTG